jgi:hypothetical protein
MLFQPKCLKKSEAGKAFTCWNLTVFGMAAIFAIFSNRFAKPTLSKKPTLATA